MTSVSLPFSLRAGALAAALIALSGAALAQHNHQGASPSEAPPAVSANAADPAASPASATPPSALPWVEAQVRRVDNAASKLSVRHGEIPNLEMPPMTMVFQVSDPAMLQGLEPGAKLRIQVQQIQGAYTITALEPLP